ncbi:MAG: hypothetical protein Q7S61_00440 [bacterium]|nr:hypothetical protein [bacterium]
MKIPGRLQSVLWSAHINHLHLEKDRYYIIHHILSFGSLDDISWLMKMYPKKEIIEVFMISFKDYSRSRFYFVKDAILELKYWHPDEKYYVKNISRNIG